MASRRTPLATYRLQLHAGFGFDDATAIADYLRDLGISHLYSSPYLQAAKGSMHGYDVIDHDSVNHELGGAEAHARMSHALRERGLGQVLDIVPNHMAIAGAENHWWWDVLENGPSSLYASYFDVDWDPPEARLRNMVLVPILGDQYGRVLEAGEIQLERDAGSFLIRYHDHMLPVDPKSISMILGPAAERSQSDLLAFLSDAFGNLPASLVTYPTQVTRRHRDKEVLRKQLAWICNELKPVAEMVDRVVSEFNQNYDQLDSLLEEQNYRLAFWRTAGRELGYRRFFDVNSLVGLRIENEIVFDDTHRLILNWLHTGVLDGVRVDHPDGLRDPARYFRRVTEAAPQAWIVAEKILAPTEKLREDWAIAGTTGYDFLQHVNALFVDPKGEKPLTRFYTEFTGESADLRAVVHEKKLLVLRGVLGSDVNRLTALFLKVCERHRRYRDYTRHEIHHTLREIIACFPVYRSYAQAETGQITETDIAYIKEAIEAAKVNRTDLDVRLFDFFYDVLTLQVTGELETEFVMRFQQFTGPAMAKGVEDTAFYVWNRLVSLNEVGGEPGQFGISLESFHQACTETQAHWPDTMLSTSTHDTKRSEDVRARINLLSEIPKHWTRIVRRWSRRNRRYKNADFPDRNTEYLLYQTLIGAWPIELDRVKEYMRKAVREAKVHTAWTDVNQPYEEALDRFLEGVLHDEEFKQDLDRFLAPLIEPGRINSLAQCLLKLTAPGVPDIYQGTELWDLSLVDPDNRRPIDYKQRQRLLTDLESATPEQILARMDEGLPKLWVTRQALRVRRRFPEAFGCKGTYIALSATGSKSEHAVAFERGEKVITIAPRLVMGLNRDWRDTRIQFPDGRWHNELTGEMQEGGSILLRTALSRFPVGLFTKETD